MCKKFQQFRYLKKYCCRIEEYCARFLQEREKHKCRMINCFTAKKTTLRKTNEYVMNTEKNWTS